MKLILSVLFLSAFVIVGCAGAEPVASEEASLVTYTVTFDVAEIETHAIRIMRCDEVTGMCEIDEPEGCRYVDTEGVTGHLCDFTVAEDETLAFNVQLDSAFACAIDDAECARLGSVHVFRDGEPVAHVRDVHGEFCNFLITSRSPAGPEPVEGAVDLDGI
ncbi:hypothetical protein K8R04_04430 [Candidatus Uhrbacteria bacterium]|nr:hypothetical protein [Candidatus Uhrbacteria bacterium]